MIYHGTTPIISMYIGTTPVIGIVKDEEMIVVDNKSNSNFITADNHTFITADNNTFIAKEE